MDKISSSESVSIGRRVMDMVIERPISFAIGDTLFYFPPPTLGKQYMVSPMFDEMEVDPNALRTDMFTTLIRGCERHPDTVCRILAIYSLRTREEIFDIAKVAEWAKRFSVLDAKEQTSLLIAVLSWEDIERYIEYLGLDKERELRARISRLQNEKSSNVTFGGRSVYGAMIDYFAQRYGWTMDYIVWGISYANLQMLRIDAIATAYLTEKEAKKLHIHGGERINGDDPTNAARIRKMFS